MFAPNTPEEYKTIIKENLAKRFAGLDAHLAENQYLMGSRFSVADAYAFVVVGWAKPMKIDLAKVEESHHLSGPHRGPSQGAGGD